LFLFTIFSIFWGCSDTKTQEEKKPLDEQTVRSALKGSLSQAEKSNAAQLKENPEDSNALMGAAYLASMRGDFDKASDFLRKAEAGASDIKTVYLRQAIVGLKAGKSLKEVRDLADRSGTNYGSLLCAEIDIVEAEDLDDIKGRLEGLKDTDFEDIADLYLSLLDREDGEDLAAANAGWALGSNYGVVLSNFNLGAEILDSSNPKDAEMLLLWTGRAIQEKSYDLAADWLKRVSKQDGLLEERRMATKVIIGCLKKPSSSVCDRKIKSLKISSGLKHATQLTAARGLIKSNPDIAKDLLDGTKGATAAYYWYQLGDVSKAEQAGEDSDVLDFLE
jgi:tetratricopeptide (TPR) repeat protein